MKNTSGMSAISIVDTPRQAQTAGGAFLLFAGATNSIADKQE